MIGTVLRSRYELAGLMSDGPVFAAYSARDRQTGLDVSIRIIKAPFGRDATFVDRLRDVVHKYRPIKSPNIEGLFEVERDEANAYIVGELTRGPTLADRIRKLAPFSIQVSVATGISLCSALDGLHRARVAHGDLNPHNIAVLADGDIRLQLTGIWEAYSGSATAATMVLPTMSPYLAPEISGGAMPSPRSDVYAVGIVLFELLSGRLPYYADTPVAMSLQHGTTPTPSVRVINPSVPPVLNEIIKKAMAKDPLLRYASATEMVDDLKTLQEALRFGKQLTWPLKGAAAPIKATPQPQKSPAKVAPVPRKADPGPDGNRRVAPRMSAIRTDAEYADQGRREKERDVPLWLAFVATAMFAIAISMVGFWVWWNMDQPRKVPVPDVKGLSISEARLQLKDSKLEMRIVSHEPNDKVEIDHILDEQPEAGDTVREGAQVAVIISSGSRFVAVPDLRGDTLDKAKSILSSLDLLADENVDRDGDKAVGKDLVLRTSPVAKSKVERNSRVHITLSAGPIGSMIGGVTPESQANFLYALHLKVDDIPNPEFIKIEMVDDAGTRVIYNERHNPGDAFDVDANSKSDHADFRFYYDGALVKTTHEEAAPQDPGPQESAPPFNQP